MQRQLSRAGSWAGEVVFRQEMLCSFMDGKKDNRKGSSPGVVEGWDPGVQSWGLGWSTEGHPL